MPAGPRDHLRSTLVAAVPILLFSLCFTNEAAADTVETVQPVVAPVVRAIEQTGTVAAANSVDLVARVSGTLEKIGYRDGQAVQAGDLLFVIEPAPYRAALAGAEASVAQAQAALTDAQQVLDRNQQLTGNAIPASEVESDRNQRDEARAQLAAAEAERDQARINLGYTEIRAPFAGFVTAHQADVGALVGQGGVTTLAQLVQLDPVEVNFDLPDRDILRIRQAAAERGRKLNDNSQIAIEAGTVNDTDYPYQGMLDYIAPLTNPETGTLSMRGRFDNPDHALLPGLFVNIRIPLRTDPDALFLPDAAIGTDQGGSYVLVIGSGGTVARVDVTLGQRGTGGQEVRGDLTRDARVVANVLSGVRAGDRLPEAQEAAATDDGKSGN